MVTGYNRLVIRCDEHGRQRLEEHKDGAFKLKCGCVYYNHNGEWVTERPRAPRRKAADA